MDPLCTIFTILLTLWNSEQKKGLLMKLFCFSSDFDETWWSCSYRCVHYNFTKFHQNWMENKKVLLIAHFSVQNFKVSVELWKLYIVRTMIVRVDGGNFLGLIYVINSEILGVHLLCSSLCSTNLAVYYKNNCNLFFNCYLCKDTVINLD